MLYMLAAHPDLSHVAALTHTFHFFFFNDTATTEIYTLSLHDALPIWSLFLTRPTLAHYIATRTELLERAGEVLGWIKSGRLKLRIQHEFPLEQAPEAHRALEGRKTTGKVLLIP